MMNKSSRTRGRPLGKSSARADILESARNRFLADGYRGATLRSIANDAGVDVALLSYYYGSKRELFGSALGLSANPAQVIATILEGPENSLSERLLTGLMLVWDDRQHNATLATLLEGSIVSPEVGRVFREMAENEMLGRIARSLRGPNAEQRAAAAVSQLAGLILLRYVLRVDPVATMTRGEVIATFGPPLRAVLAPSTYVTSRDAANAHRA